MLVLPHFQLKMVGLMCCFSDLWAKDSQGKYSVIQQKDHNFLKGLGSFFLEKTVYNTECDNAFRKHLPPYKEEYQKF